MNHERHMNNEAEVENRGELVKEKLLPNTERDEYAPMTTEELIAAIENQMYRDSQEI